MKKKISFRFRIADWILGGTLEKTINYAVDKLDILLTFCCPPIHHDGSINMDSVSFDILLMSMSILINYIEMYSDTFKFKLADLLYGHNLRERLMNAFDDLCDIKRSIEQKDMSINNIDIIDLQLIQHFLTNIIY